MRDDLLGRLLEVLVAGRHKASRKMICLQLWSLARLRIAADSTPVPVIVGSSPSVFTLTINPSPAFYSTETPCLCQIWWDVLFTMPRRRCHDDCFGTFQAGEESMMDSLLLERRVAISIIWAEKSSKQQGRSSR